MIDEPVREVRLHRLKPPPNSEVYLIKGAESFVPHPLLAGITLDYSQQGELFRANCGHKLQQFRLCPYCGRRWHLARWGPGVPDDIGGVTLRKSVFPADTPSTIAVHFAHCINETFVGVWAQVAGGALTITTRSPAPAYSFSFSESHTSANRTVTVSGSLTGGVVGNWVIDDTVTPVLNRAARDWHGNYFAELVARGMSCVVAFSQELVLFRPTIVKSG